MAIIDRGELIVSGSVQELLRDSAVFTTEIRAEPEKDARKVLVRMKLMDAAYESESPIRIKVSKDKIPGIIKKLVEAGVKIHSVIPRTSIEDYFLTLTEQDA
jgi:ABC-2 type transport system ATP-binding protein